MIFVFFHKKVFKEFQNFIFCLLVPDFLKTVFSTMDLFYNRIVLYNRTISSLVLFIFTGKTFGIFNTFRVLRPLEYLLPKDLSFWVEGT